MIYTLTLNPCLDYVMECDTVLQGETNRSKTESISFGGKGINVSFVLKELGIPSVALGFIGGFTGRELENRVKEKGIETDFVNVENATTRINVKIKGQEITEINAAGFSVCEKDLQNLYSKLSFVSAGDTVVMGGSAPKGAPDSIYEDISRNLSTKGVRIVIDTTGKKLINCLKYNPFLIKPNKAELEELIDTSLDTQQKIADAAKSLQKMGACNVLVSMGKDGALLVDSEEKVYVVKAHKITPVNTVGAGDSMVAGFLCGYKKGFQYALDLGNACGAATSQCPGLANRAHIEKFINLL